jgi:hypothetical protein
MKIKTSDLIDLALDWAVSQCVGIVWEQGDLDAGHYGPGFKPSTVWGDGGPIIEREGIFPSLTDIERHDDGQVTFDQKFRARTPAQYLDHDEGMYGPTPLIAAMRCFVASRLGDEVEVPDELA